MEELQAPLSPSSPGLVRRALHGTGARFGLAIAVVFLALTLFAPLLAPFQIRTSRICRTPCRHRPRDVLVSEPIGPAATP